MARSATGQMRIDYGNTSVITNPAQQKMLLLDHLKKEVRAIPMPAAPSPQAALPKVPGMPGAPTPPAAPPMNVQELGTRVIQGVPAVGKKITMPPLTPPKPPAAPQIPGMPGKPAVPGMPAVPATPQALVAEVWTHATLAIPVLTRITGPFGQQICHCTNTKAGEPNPAAFQVPPDYKQVGLPAAPAPPAMPAVPSLPKPPAMPGAPSLPTPPAIPAAPSLPQPPPLPKPPGFKF